jgi:hypothetical protein
LKKHRVIIKYFIFIGASLCLNNVLGMKTIRSCAVQAVAPSSPWTSITLQPPSPELREQGIDAVADVTYKGKITFLDFRFQKNSLVIHPPNNVRLTTNEASANLARQINACIIAAFPDRGVVQEPVQCEMSRDEARPIEITHALPYQHSMWNISFHPWSLFYYQVHLDGMIRIEEIAVGQSGHISMPRRGKPSADMGPSVEVTADFASELKSAMGYASEFPRETPTSLGPVKVVFTPPRRSVPNILGYFQVQLNNGVILSEIALLEVRGLPPVILYPCEYLYGSPRRSRRAKRVRSLYEPTVGLRAILEPKMRLVYSEYQKRPNGAYREVKYPHERIPMTVQDIVLVPGENGDLASVTLTLNNLLRINTAKLKPNGEFELPIPDKADGQISPVRTEPDNLVTLQKAVHAALQEQWRRDQEISKESGGNQ